MRGLSGGVRDSWYDYGSVAPADDDRVGRPTIAEPGTLAHAAGISG